ncbi:MAG: Tetratricopeptide repeat domain protein [Myxococcales bacterium]|nr:Tetratricopeptide repeat domain protein [Myxococcales bacterium]
MSARLTSVLLIVAALLAAAPVYAGDKRAAAAHFQRGRALFESNSYAAALDEFTAGYDAYPLPGFLVNIGQCQRKLDRIDDAAASFAKFLDSDVADPRLRSEVQEALSEISAERSRRLAADLEARRQRDEAEAHHPAVVDEDMRRAEARRVEAHRAAVATADLHPRGASASALTSAPVAAVSVENPAKSRKWVWALVGALAAGAVAGGITLAVIETRQPSQQAGSLGLLDGRR